MHFIEFRKNATLRLEKEGQTQQACRIEIGARFIGHVRCYVLPKNGMHCEVADIDLADGSGVLRGVPCGCFLFLDEFDWPGR